jgi:hypothetical protein
MLLVTVFKFRALIENVLMNFNEMMNSKYFLNYSLTQIYSAIQLLKVGVVPVFLAVEDAYSN